MITRYVTKQHLLTKMEGFLGSPCFASFVPYRLLYGRRDGRTKKRVRPADADGRRRCGEIIIRKGHKTDTE